MTEINPESIHDGLTTNYIGMPILYFQETTSTMDIARIQAEQGAIEGTLVIAETQTAGRGRFSREWISPPGANLYFSLILRPTISQLPAINLIATLSILKSIRSVTGLEPRIKWPNDIKINGRKLGGILIETKLSFEEVEYTILGIGLNVNFDLLPYPEISSTATSLSHELPGPVNRLTLLKESLAQIETLYELVREGKSLIEEWKPALETLGKRITVQWENHSEEGIAQDVDDHGNLILKKIDGTKITLIAGEVTLQANVDPECIDKFPQG